MGSTVSATRSHLDAGVGIAVGARRHPWRAHQHALPPPEPMVATWRIAVNAVAMFAVVFAGGLLLAATAPRLFGYEAVVVSSGSMSPAIRTGDVVITTSPDDVTLGPGTVINFERDGETFLHRIVSVTSDGYTTAGDSNDVADSVVVTADDVRGIGVVRVPFAGWPTLWIERGAWGRLLLVIALSVGALYLSRTAWLLSDNDVAAPHPVDDGSIDDEKEEDEAGGSLTRLHPYVSDLKPPPIPPEALVDSRLHDDTGAPRDPVTNQPL